MNPKTLAITLLGTCCGLLVSLPGYAHTTTSPSLRIGIPSFPVLTEAVAGSIRHQPQLTGMMRSAIDDMSSTISTGPAAPAPRMYAANMSNGIQTGTVISATNQASTRIIMVTPTTTMAGGAMAITAGIRAGTKKPG